MAIDPSDWPIDPYTVDGVELADRLNAVIPSEFNALNSGKANLAGGNTFTGNQTFGGVATSTRIMGDMNSVPNNTRLLFQNSVPNTNTSVGAIPSGTATASNFVAYDRADAANSVYCQLHATAGATGINCTGIGSQASVFPSFTLSQSGRPAFIINGSNGTAIFVSTDGGNFHGTIIMQNSDGSKRRYLRLDNSSNIEIVNQAVNDVPIILANNGDIYSKGASGRFKNVVGGGGEAHFYRNKDANQTGVTVWESERNIGYSCVWLPGAGITTFGPLGDNTQFCGWTLGRWNSVWAANGTIQTSDQREKSQLRSPSEAELECAIELAGMGGFYKWLKDINEHGDMAKEHHGHIAQQVVATMEKHGLDWTQYEFVRLDVWDEQPAQYTQNPDNPDDPEDLIVMTPAVPAGDRYSLRYDELHGFIILGLRENQLRMEARLAKLEALLKS